MPTILITGGAGFIGSHLTTLLLSKGFSVVVLDNFSYGKRKFLPENNPSLHIHEVDILDKSALQTHFELYKPETVFHLAAIHHIPTCEQKPELAIRTNIEGTENIILAAQSVGVKRFIFASSGAVYEIVDEELKENSTPVVPHDIYSITKRAGEDLIRLYAERKVFKSVVCRLFNTVGSHETNAHLVPDILQQVLENKTEIALGNLSPLRSYIHVLDVAEAFATIGFQEFKNDFETFNIGTESEHSVADILQLIAEISGKALQAFQHPDRVRKVDRHRQRANLAKTTSLTGWSPKRSLKEALQDAYQEAIHV
ncbi:MAG: NAD-dependent epimerase/dehydratase family protein [Bacteroidetes bacterium]|nr:NAD-dependent epimerase/dehydratase family protein [Bacteroidota bacterium]MBP6402041.1 NAD-dependent epimerase/dehydratase family protein [Bacteroidia bacterium]MBK6837703.1 NAD-dependent epimerase/dehydratase family protein [Bacteroidota bacterium]MBK9525431.1 NAD-dependent epimerase/dehydratase family protein [Bacteroidota bacterium]MBK9542295.1 NAD-dependent epimerase/dehydratase family protein [Bacteroidota bacterium]